MSTMGERPIVPEFATDEPTVGAYAYHYGGLQPVIVVSLLEGGDKIRVDMRGCELTVPKANYKFAVFPEVPA